MTKLTPERRKEIGERTGAIKKEINAGWPKPVALLSDTEYYQKTNDEFNSRMENKSWK
jgi:hypothetical protein